MITRFNPNEEPENSRLTCASRLPAMKKSWSWLDSWHFFPSIWPAGMEGTYLCLYPYLHSYVYLSTPCH